MNRDEAQRVSIAFNIGLDNAMKKMISDGIYPDSPVWPLLKYMAMQDVSKEMKFNMVLDKTWDRYVSMSKKPILNSYKFLRFVNRVWLLKDFFKKIHYLDGLKIWVKDSTNQTDDILRNYQMLSIYEPETTKIVKEYVKEGNVCVDIGASIGYFTLQFARQVGKNGRVFAIEPTDFQQPFLKKNIELNGYGDRVKQIAVGAWDKEEVLKMPRNAPEYVQTELLCRPVDDILEENGIWSIDFIKIDTDGAEPQVLKGLIRTIERSPNMKMVIEYYPRYVKDAGGDMKAIDDILNKYFTYEVIPGDYGGEYWNYFCQKK